MASFLSRLFGGKSDKAGGKSGAKRGDPVPYENFIVQGAPEPAGDQWRLASSTDNMFTVAGSGADLGAGPIAVAR